MEKRSEKISIISCVFVLIISFKELVGRNPPVEIKVIEKFKPLKSLTPDIEKRIKIKIEKKI